jgi:hypothetical protein
MKTFIGDFTYYCLFELFFAMPPLIIQPIMATISKQLDLELLLKFLDRFDSLDVQCFGKMVSNIL